MELVLCKNTVLMLDLSEKHLLFDRALQESK